MPELEFKFDMSLKLILDVLLANGAKKAQGLELAICETMVELGVLPDVALTDSSYLAFDYHIVDRLVLGNHEGKRLPGILCKMYFSTPSKYITSAMGTKLKDMGKKLFTLCVEYISKHCPVEGVDYNNIFNIWPGPWEGAQFVDKDSF